MKLFDNSTKYFRKYALHFKALIGDWGSLFKTSEIYHHANFSGGRLNKQEKRTVQKQPWLLVWKLEEFFIALTLNVSDDFDFIPK